MTATAGGTAIAQPLRGYSFRRYYDPQTGQFLNVDPAVDQTEAAYAYASGDPIDNIDPSGLDICAFGHCLGTPSLRDVSNGLAGFGDMITFGGTAWVRGEINNAFGLPNEVNYCSSWYTGGGYAGFGTSLLLGGAGLLGDAAEGGGLLERVRAVDWADETGGITVRKGWPEPPGFNSETWRWGSASRPSLSGEHLWDPNGGEWRWHPADKWHDAHWDYNPHDAPNAPWQRIYTGGSP